MADQRQRSNTMRFLISSSACVGIRLPEQVLVHFMMEW